MSSTEPAHDHFDVRSLARTDAPHAVTMAHDESNDLARAIRKIERTLAGGIG